MTPQEKQNKQKAFFTSALEKEKPCMDENKKEIIQSKISKNILHYSFCPLGRIFFNLFSAQLCP